MIYYERILGWDSDLLSCTCSTMNGAMQSWRLGSFSATAWSMEEGHWLNSICRRQVNWPNTACRWCQVLLASLFWCAIIRRSCNLTTYMHACSVGKVLTEFYLLYTRAVSRVAVLPVRHGIALNPPSNASVGIPRKVFSLQSYVYEILKSTRKYTKWHKCTLKHNILRVFCH